MHRFMITQVRKIIPRPLACCLLLSAYWATPLLCLAQPPLPPVVNTAPTLPMPRPVPPVEVLPGAPPPAPSPGTGPPPQFGNSLWARRDPYFANLFVDNRPRKIGDVLTVVVSETTGIEHKDERDHSKKTSMSGTFSFEGNISGNQVSQKAGSGIDTSAATDREFGSKVDYTSDRRLLDRMTVMVVDVLPNGNVIVEGYRKRVVSGEMRMLKIRGVVWPPHVGPGNTIQSQYIANFEVYYLGRGPETGCMTNGWFGKMVNVFWPF